MNLSAILMDEALWKAWWKRNTFLLPPGYGGHRHVWTNITAGVAGCKLCGIVHACSAKQANAIPCVCIFTEDSSTVCEITGIVIGTGMLTDNTISVQSYNKNYTNPDGQLCTSHVSIQLDLQENMQRFVQNVRDMVQLLIYSPQARTCREGAYASAVYSVYSRHMCCAATHYKAPHMCLSCAAEFSKYKRKIQAAMMQYTLGQRYTYEAINMIDALQSILLHTRIVRNCLSNTTLPNPRHFEKLVLTIVNVLLVTRYSICPVPVTRAILTRICAGLLMFLIHLLEMSVGEVLFCPWSTRRLMVYGKTTYALFLRSQFCDFCCHSSQCCMNISIFIRNISRKVKTTSSVSSIT